MNHSSKSIDPREGVTRARIGRSDIHRPFKLASQCGTVSSTWGTLRLNPGRLFQNQIEYQTLSWFLQGCYRWIFLIWHAERKPHAFCHRSILYDQRHRAFVFSYITTVLNEMSQHRWYMWTVLATWEGEASLSYRERPCLKNKAKTKQINMTQNMTPHTLEQGHVHWRWLIQADKNGERRKGQS